MKIGVIGGGPAGITCAVQLKRFGLDVVVFECKELGGLIRNANRVENYPGFFGSGVELAEKFVSHFDRYDIEVLKENVELLEYDGKFLVKTDKGSYDFDIVIVASGSKAKKLDFDNVLYEIDSLLDVSGKSIVIVGSGDIAFDYALNLARNNKVVLVNKSDKVKALQVLSEEVFSNPDIDYVENGVVDEFSSSKVKMGYAGKNEEVDCDYLIGAIGREPNKDFMDVDEKALIAEGKLYLIGDVKGYRQVGIAVGEALDAAMRIYEDLK